MQRETNINDDMSVQAKKPIEALSTLTASTAQPGDLAPHQLAAMAHQLVQESLNDPWGEISSSIYDTALVITLLEPVSQWEKSISFLLQKQFPDGSWGWERVPKEYKLIPTLAATMCFLHLSLRAAIGEDIPADVNALAHTAKLGLCFLASLLTEDLWEKLPDTVAIELLLPALIEEISRMQNELGEIAQQGSCQKHTSFWQEVHGCIAVRLPSPPRERLERLRTAARLGGKVPGQVSYSLEALGNTIDFGSFLAYEKDGIFGGSPAVTAAMIARSSLTTEHSISALVKIAARFHGTFPSQYPIAIFERAWVTFYLLKAGIALPEDQKQALLRYLAACVGPYGAAYDKQFFPEGDSTGVLLATLSDLGTPIDLPPLLRYEGETYFRTFQEEWTPSVSTNAHILEALGSFINCHSASSDTLRAQTAAAKGISYLLAQQREQGYWDDKWHSSPYYATSCCALTLQRFDRCKVGTAINRAVTWVLQTQREDGSWGKWFGTLEETAFALRILAQADQVINTITVKMAIQQGKQFLWQHLDAPASALVRTPLWHGKDLYEPVRITRAIVLGALYQ